MDFDLFDLGEDDILCSILESTQQPTATEAFENDSVNVPEFNCNGEDTNSNTQFSSESFIRNNFINTAIKTFTNKTAELITLTNFEFNAKNLRVQSVSEYVFGEARMNVQYLVANVRGSIGSLNDGQVSFYQRRQQVTQLLYLVLKSTHPMQWQLLRPQLMTLYNLIDRTSSGDLYKQIYFANSSKGNECNLPAYHLLHGLLEWRILFLAISYKFELLEKVKDDHDEGFYDNCYDAFIKQLKTFIESLVICSMHHYAKKRTTELLFTSPFPCTCFKETWLLLQQMLKKSQNDLKLTFQKDNVEDGKTLDFWKITNSILLDNIKQRIDSFKFTATSYYQFVLTLQAALTRLHGFRSNGQYSGPPHSRLSSEQQLAADNFEFSEACTQQFLNGNPKEEELRVYICLLMPLVLQWWPPRPALITVLWEYFHRRLNSSFYISTGAIGNLAVTCGSGRAYLEKYRSLLQKIDVSSTITPDANLSSYTLFCLVLGKSLERFNKMNSLSNVGQVGNQTQKLLGRIYSKFSPAKLLASNETGIHHIIELFLVLALCGEFNEMLPKVRDLMLTISLEKIPLQRQIAITKGHMALLILSSEQRLDMSDYIKKLLQQLQAIRHEIAVSKIISDSLLDIFQHADDFQRGEKLFIDAWLPTLLQNCTPVEQQRTLEALHLIFETLRHNHGSDHLLGANADVLKALNMHILPFVKQQFVQSFSEWFPQLAADFCHHADSPQFPKLLNYFVDAHTANRQALPNFLLHVLKRNSNTSTPGSFSANKQPQIEDNVVMRVWLKSLVLLTPNNEVVSKLTNCVVNLKSFSLMCDLSPRELLDAKEPLCVFVAAVGKRYDELSNNSNDFKQRCQIADNFNTCLKDFDKWLQMNTSTVNTSNNEQAKLLGDRPETLFRFYSFIAIVIYNCPHIVYAKSKINCFFHIAITRYILPTSIQLGKKPEGRTAHFIHKIWPVLVQGIGRLSFKNDAYVQKTLTDLIQKWTPHFRSISPNSKVVARPFITCVQGSNYELSLFVLERLTSMFLSTQRRQAQDPNACLVITIFQEVIDAVLSDTTTTGAGASDNSLAVQRLSTFMKATLLVTLEHILMVDECVPSRNLLLEMLRRLICNSVFRNSTELQSLLSEHLRIITKKHLAYYTFFYFDLLLKLTQISHEVVRRVMDFILAEVRVVEQKRSAGQDNRIRSCLQKLQMAISNEEKKEKS